MLTITENAKACRAKCSKQQRHLRFSRKHVHKLLRAAHFSEEGSADGRYATLSDICKQISQRMHGVYYTVCVCLSIGCKMTSESS